MQGIAEFQKVSFSQFLKDSIETGFADKTISPDLIKILWDRIKIPTRATGGSAGYDFYLPFPFSVPEEGVVTIPTGIRANIRPGWFLMIVPRSSLGFKHGMRLLNSVGIIDSDYFYAENEGHIIAKITVEKNMCLQDGDRFIQGILMSHGVTSDDTPIFVARTGGIGSTGI